MAERNIRRHQIGRSTFAFAAAAHGGKVATIVEAVSRALLNLNDAKNAVDQDQALSEIGRHRALVEPLRAGFKAIASEAERHEQAKREVQEARTKLEEVPDADAVGQIQDMMVSERFYSRDANERAKLLEMMKRGDPQTQRIALALMRSPLRDTPLDQLGAGEARAIWAASCRKQAPEAYAELDKQEAAIAWAEPIVARAAQLARELLHSASPTSQPRMTVEHLIYDAGVREGHRAFSISDPAWDSFVKGQQGGNAAKWNKPTPQAQQQPASQEAA